MEEKNKVEDQSQEPVQTEEGQQRLLFDQMVELIDDQSRDGNLTDGSGFYEAPFKLDEEKLKIFIEYIGQQEGRESIQVIRGQEEIYFYRPRWITAVYADTLVRIREHNLFQLIAETVRQESKIYPRPTDVKLFSIPPYHFPKERIEGVIQQLQNEEAYQDIELIKASTGAIYLYSSQYMKKAYARSLVEWQEVERFENP